MAKFSRVVNKANLGKPAEYNDAAPIPIVKTPFGLELRFFPEVDEFLEKNPTLISAANIMLKPYISEGTEKCYGQVIKDFIRFIAKKDLTVTEMSESLVIEFIGVRFSEKPMFSYFCKMLPSLVVLENYIKPSDKATALTNKVVNMVTSFKRHLCVFKKPVKKGCLFPIDNIKILIEHEIMPFIDQVKKINAKNFRAIFRAVIIYFTFCRFSDFKKLKDVDFYDHGNFIEIIFKNSKNDQYFKGTNSILTSYDNSVLCPVKLTKLYFKKFGLNFASATSRNSSYVNFYLTKQGSAIKSKSLSQSNATKWTKLLFSKYNMSNVNFTEKSMKIAGVTALLDSGEPLDNVAIAGRWRTSSTPMHYRNTSYKYRDSIAKNIPLTNF